jgi:hypothetical protein
LYGRAIGVALGPQCLAGSEAGMRIGVAEAPKGVCEPRRLSTTPSGAGSYTVGVHARLRQAPMAAVPGDSPPVLGELLERNRE